MVVLVADRPVVGLDIGLWVVLGWVQETARLIPLVPDHPAVGEVAYPRLARMAEKRVPLQSAQVVARRVDRLGVMMVSTGLVVVVVAEVPLFLVLLQPLVQKGYQDWMVLDWLGLP